MARRTPPIEATHMSAAIVLASILPLITIFGLWLFLRENRLHNWVHSNKEDQDDLANELIAIFVPFQLFWFLVTNVNLGGLHNFAAIAIWCLLGALAGICLAVVGQGLPEDWMLLIFGLVWGLIVHCLCFSIFRKAKAAKAQASSEKAAPAVPLERLEAQA